MGLILTFPLRDGATPQPRSEVLAAMTAILVNRDAWRNEADAIRTLIWARDPAGGRLFTTYEVMRDLDNVRQAAMQTVVADAMSA